MSGPRTACPVCQTSQIRTLSVASEIAQVDYFMCERCLHIWNVPKRANGPINHVSDPAVSAERLRGGKK